MTAKKASTPEFDFDGFDEAAALADSADALGLKFAFGGGVFAGRFRDGEVVSLPLDVPRKIVDGVDLEGLDPFEQVTAILKALDLGDRADKLVEQGLVSSLLFAQKYFTTIEKVMKVSLGE